MNSSVYERAPPSEPSCLVGGGGVVVMSGLSAVTTGAVAAFCSAHSCVPFTGGGAEEPSCCCSCHSLEPFGKGVYAEAFLIDIREVFLGFFGVFVGDAGLLH